ncbi:MAG: hypothetical protein JNM76_15055 [Betaproteobacteria bacterium]|nr:hypothetical protein [Betaproteobacteria bacterium]
MKTLLLLLPPLLLSGCALLIETAPQVTQSTAAMMTQLPLSDAWHEGRRAQYITTDVSDEAMAIKANANFAPRLRDAIAPGPKVPGRRHALERVYKFTNFSQPVVFPSIPLPSGPASRDASYSPLWQVVEVTWTPGSVPAELRSEEAILKAEDAGRVQLAILDVVVNCPVIWSEAGGLLPGAGRFRTP